jgi:putative SOS response-associated peptidase YedK
VTEPKYPRRNLYLEADVMDSLRDIGNSNASRGVRVAVAFYEQHHFTKLETHSALMPIDKWYQPKKKAKAEDVPFTFDGEK